MRAHKRVDRWVRRVLGCLALYGFGLMTVGCAASPAQTFTQGAVLLQEEFDSPFAWENYVHPELGFHFRVEDGVYRAYVRGDVMWGLNVQTHQNVVIHVDTQQLSTDSDNAYGVICRASPSNNGDGYYFLISADNHFTIRRGAQDQIEALIPWTYTDAIQGGQSINRLRAVCIDDYLAFYVNGTFVGETEDRRFHEGFAGLTAAVPEGSEVDIAFDALTLREAALNVTGG